MKKITETEMTPEQLDKLKRFKAKRQTPAVRAEEEAIREEFRDNPGLADQMKRGEVRDEDIRVPAQSDHLTTVVIQLKQTRESQGLTLRQAAGRAGLNPEAVSRLENGKNPNPTLDTLYRYAAALGVKLSLTVQADESAGNAPLSPEQKDILTLVSMLGPEEARRQLLALESGARLPAESSARAALFSFNFPEVSPPEGNEDRNASRDVKEAALDERHGVDSYILIYIYVPLTEPFEYTAFRTLEGSRSWKDTSSRLRPGPVPGSSSPQSVNDRVRSTLKDLILSLFVSSDPKEHGHR